MRKERNDKARSNRSFLKAYDAQRVTSRPKRTIDPKERERRQRARMLEALDKNRKWVSLWDVEHGRAQ